MEKTKKNRLIIPIGIIIVIILIATFVMTKNGADHSTGTNPQTNVTNSKNTQESNLKNYLVEQDRIMSNMMLGMGRVPTSGNASIHFLKGMIPHHESAIEMAESYLKYGGQSSDLKQIAEEIIAAQTKEIDDMNVMIQQIIETGHQDTQKESGYLKEYNKMMQTHESGGHNSHNTPANVEQAFAEGMIMHHEMAIQMADAILDYTDEDDVTLLAETIIQIQEKEIEEMNYIINTLKSTS